MPTLFQARPLLSIQACSQYVGTKFVHAHLQSLKIRFWVCARLAVTLLSGTEKKGPIGFTLRFTEAVLTGR